MPGSLRALEDASLEDAFALSLAAGCLHALTGPDHIAAVVALVAAARRERAARDHETSPKAASKDEALWKSCAKQGSRWAIGHTVGLGIITGVFFACARRLDVDAVQLASDIIVGITMIVLGGINLRSGIIYFIKERRTAAHVEDCDASGSHEEEAVVVVEAGSEAHREAHELNIPHEHVSKTEDGIERNDEGTNGVDAKVQSKVMTEKQTLWRRLRAMRTMSGDSTTSKGRWSAYVVGFVHGVSGLAGVVYVLPVVFLTDAERVVLYLFGFFLMSMLAMTAFAAILGSAPQSGPRLAVRIQIACGVGVLAFGVTWIALTAVGKLNF